MRTMPAHVLRCGAAMPASPPFQGDIITYLQHLAATRDDGSAGLKPATLNRRLTPLRLLFQRLHRYHLITVNPMEFIKGRAK